MQSKAITPEEIKRIEGIKWYRHNYVKTFYLLNKEKNFELYEKNRKKKRLNPKDWNVYVNSKELHDSIYSLICSVTNFTKDALAYGEMAENFGMEMRTMRGEQYIALPLVLHDNINLCPLNPEALNPAIMANQVATRAFITMLNHMFFKDLYGKPFIILKNIIGTESTWVKLNNDYEYIPV